SDFRQRPRILGGIPQAADAEKVIFLRPTLEPRRITPVRDDTVLGTLSVQADERIQVCATGRHEHRRTGDTTAQPVRVRIEQLWWRSAKNGLPPRVHARVSDNENRRSPRQCSVSIPVEVDYIRPVFLLQRDQPLSGLIDILLRAI